LIVAYDGRSLWQDTHCVLIPESAQAFRTATTAGKGDREVDLVIADNSGRVVAMEITAAASVADRDFRHLRSLRRDLGQDLLHGLVVYLGRNTLSFGDGLTAVPLAALWS